MANQVRTFMVKEDEVALLRFLERYTLEVYPRRVPVDWQPFRARPSEWEHLPVEELYLVATEIGPAAVDKVKRGKDKGLWHIDEVRSPVIYWERCRPNEDAELLSGQLWAELDITPQTGRRTAAADRLRTMFFEMDSWLNKNFRKSHPRGYVIGTNTAREVKQQGLKLRENEHRGRLLEVHS